MNDYVSKPIDPDLLERALRSLSPSVEEARTG